MKIVTAKSLNIVASYTIDHKIRFARADNGAILCYAAVSAKALRNAINGILEGRL